MQIRNELVKLENLHGAPNDKILRQFGVEKRNILTSNILLRAIFRIEKIAASKINSPEKHLISHFDT